MPTFTSVGKHIGIRRISKKKPTNRLHRDNTHFRDLSCNAHLLGGKHCHGSPKRRILETSSSAFPTNSYHRKTSDTGFGASA